MATVTVGVRVDAEVARRAKARIEREGRTVSDVMREVLERIANDGVFPYQEANARAVDSAMAEEFLALEAISHPAEGFAELTDADIKRMMMERE